jgi:hypothetical protein
MPEHPEMACPNINDIRKMRDPQRAVKGRWQRMYGKVFGGATALLVAATVHASRLILAMTSQP